MWTKIADVDEVRSGGRRSPMVAGRRRVAVIGGGIAGLTVAASLDPTRFDVTLYEAQPERTGGAALGLWPDARKALQRKGIVLDGVADARVEIHAHSGARRLSAPMPPVAQVRRAELMAALAAAVPASVERVTAQIDDPEADARLAGADVVIGADGVRSRVRGIVDARAAERRATPWVTLRGIVPTGRGIAAGDTAGADVLRGPGGIVADEGAIVRQGVEARIAHEYWGSGRLFGDASVVGGRYWFTAHRPGGSSSGASDDLWAEPLDVERVVADARQAFVDTAPQVRETLEWAATEARAPGAGGILATRLWTTPSMRRYVNGRYVVIGDAAHAGLPNLARGASDAIIDAVTLAAALSTGSPFTIDAAFGADSSPDVGSSLRLWQARRLPVTQANRLAASAVMRLATSGVMR